MSYFVDKTGMVFGNWTVLSYAGCKFKEEGSKTKRSYWLCKCICGVEKEVAGSALTGGSSKSCGCSEEMLPGKKFNRLTLVEFSHKNRYGHSFYQFICDCGNTRIYKGADVLFGSLKSCGCYRKDLMSVRDRLPEGVAAFNSLYSYYKSSAVKREISFGLDEEEFFSLTKGNCAYCGISPWKEWKGTARKNSAYIYNGIDRVDSYEGYVFNNCVSCCTVCNIAKNDMTLEEFNQWIDRVINFRNNNVKEPVESGGKN